MPKLSSSSSSPHPFETLPLWLFSSHRAAKMKSKASSFRKQVASLLMSTLKAKSAAVKSKTSAIKTRLIIFGLLHNHKVIMSAISHKIHALISQKKDECATAAAEDDRKTIVLHNADMNEAPLPDFTEKVDSGEGEEFMKEVEGYANLRNSLLDDEDGELGDDDSTDSQSQGHDHGEFLVEHEIDRAAELFIERFYRQMRMQRLESFKRYEEMLERSA
uniref:DNA-directed RNA polymerase subunit gamma n=1 Tax=Anthurium amnicola TaxID=1678845 RepID=A0A1D1XUF7_9ARAE